MSDKPVEICIGLMSGSSMDGLDIAACRFTGTDDHKFSFELLAAETIPMPEDLIKRIKNLQQGTARDFVHCDSILGQWIGKQIKDFIENQGIQAKLIGSHGHTIFHEPGSGYSSQIGHPAHIAAQSGIPVVSDFRMSDVAYGGQGAPMIPIAEKLLWPAHHQFVNLGGIVNIAFHNQTEVMAYDVCAGNQVLNFLAGQNGLPFDRDGILSQNGTIIPAVLEQYLSLDYFNMKAPKSLANDWVTDVVFPIFDSDKFKVGDLLVTAMEGAAILLAQAVKDHAGFSSTSVMITGGGAHHPGWIDRINNQMLLRGLPEVYIPGSNIVDFKEAIMMALAAWLRWEEKPNFIKSVTGSSHDVSGGAIYLPA